MPTINQEWGKCVRDLLTAHSLTLRGAMLKAEGKVSHTTIKDWCDGIVPHDATKALDFLSYFPREEAMSCLNIVNIPVPPDWLGQLNGAAEAMELLKDPLFKDVVIRMRSSRNPAAIKRILETAKEILEEEAKEESEQSH